MEGKKIIGVGEIFLLISLSFAVSFFMSENFVDAQEQITRLPPSTAADRIADPTIISKTPSAAPAASGVNPYAGGLYGGIRGDGPVVEEAAKKAAEETTKETGTAGTGLSGVFGGTAFGTTGMAGTFSALTSGVLWGAAVWGGLKLVSGLFGLNDKQSSAVALAGGAGTFVGSTLYFMTGPSGVFTAPLGLTPGMFGFLTGAGVAVAVFLATYKKEKTEIIQFMCEPWQPPVGGKSCEVCNEDPLMPCSEYRCKSLGQACEIVNKGTTEEMCVWVNKADVTAPTIEPWPEALKPTELRYVPDGNGFKITQVGAPGGCLEPFSRLEFGVRTNEPSQCRVGLEADYNYSSGYLLGGSTMYDIEHAQTNFRIPNPFAPEEDGEVPPINNDALFTMYVRCRDANGNGEDGAPVPFRFCVQPGPDTREPIIEGFSIADESPVRFEVDSYPIEVYINEPAECRWSSRDQSYETMENEMTCKNGNQQRFNANLQYVCSGSLTGIQDRQNNDFYFRCKDQPDAAENVRRVNSLSKKLTLRGTEPLTIESVGPSGEILGSTSTVEINLTATTAHGAMEGQSTCFYEFEEDGQFNIAMLGEWTFSHVQPIALSGGNYNVYYRCIDQGGNLATANSSFDVVVDTQQPLISRAYRDGPNIKVITSEKAKCVYSLNSCNYEFGTALPMSYESSGGTIRQDRHLVEWNKDKTYYIKCEDFQGKRVAPDQCSIIVQGAEF